MNISLCSEFFRGGKSPDSLRDELKLATEQKDRPTLEKLIEEGEHVEYPELAYEMREARLTLKELGGGYGGQIYIFDILFYFKVCFVLKKQNNHILTFYFVSKAND